MNRYLDPTIFDSLNARQLTPSQVAQSFIPPDGFFELVKRNNNILIGPRGSGKTTLLKMLQLPALIAWDHEQASNIAQNIDYISAFIPTDRAWEKQWSLIDNLRIDDNVTMQLKKTIFTTHTLRQIIDAFRFCRFKDLLNNDCLAKFYVELSKEKESILVKQIAEYLYLTMDIPSLDFVMLQLKRRLSEIGEFINKNLHQGNVSLTSAMNKYVYIDFMTAITTIIEIFNTVMASSDQKWALLFDELEIAPKDIRNELFNHLRSTDDQKVLFKLSISPYAEDLNLSQPTGSYAGHDYVPINLTYARKEKARPFCESLFNQMCRFYGLDNITPKMVFGVSEFDRGNEERNKLSAYGKNSDLYNRFKSLEKKDPSFCKYMQDKNIDIENMDTMPESERASKVRKITNIVCIREAFLNEDQNIRAIKKTKLYTGIKSIFDVTEGNPRLFLGIIGPLLKRYAHSENTMVAENIQTSVLNIAIDRFRALLSTIPAPEEKGKGLITLLDFIGYSFQNKILKEDFTPEPATSFIIDEQVPESIKKLLGMALNAGAIIYIHDSEETPLLDSLEKKEFRLSYLLAPCYRLPMIVNKAQKLSKILEKDNEGIVENIEKKGQILFRF